MGHTDAHTGRWFLSPGSLHSAQDRTMILNLPWWTRGSGQLGGHHHPQGSSITHKRPSFLCLLLPGFHSTTYPFYPLCTSRHLTGGPVLISWIHLFDTSWILLGETRQQHIRLQFLDVRNCQLSVSLYDSVKYLAHLYEVDNPWGLEVCFFRTLPQSDSPNIRGWGFGVDCASERGFPGGLTVKNLPTNAGDIKDSGSIPGSGRSPGGGHGNPLQYSCLENPLTEEPDGLQSLGSQFSQTPLKQLSTHTHASERGELMRFFSF